MSGPQQPNQKQVPVSPTEERIWNYRLKRRTPLRVCFSFSSNAVFMESLFHIYFNSAMEAFQRHNLDIEACPLGIVPAAGSLVDNANTARTNIFPIGNGLDEEYDLSADERLLETITTLHPRETHGNRLQVIFYPFASAKGRVLAGLTRPGGRWPPFVLVDPRPSAGDGMTLAHEMGHAAKVKDHENHHNLYTYDRINEWENQKPAPIYRPIMSYVVNRNRFTNHQVVDFAQSFFGNGTR